MSDLTERRLRNEAKLKRLGVKRAPLSDHNIPEFNLRSPREVAARALGILHFMSAGHGVSVEIVHDYLTENNLDEALTPTELRLLKHGFESQGERNEAQWQLEAAYALLWALRHVPELPLPIELCDGQSLVAGLPTPQERAAGWLAHATLRSADEIADQCDLCWRVLWVARDERVRGGENPLELDERIVVLWYQALSWVLSANTAWDEIDIST